MPTPASYDGAPGIGSRAVTGPLLVGALLGGVLGAAAVEAARPHERECAGDSAELVCLSPELLSAEQVSAIQIELRGRLAQIQAEMNVARRELSGVIGESTVDIAIGTELGFEAGRGAPRELLSILARLRSLRRDSLDVALRLATVCQQLRVMTKPDG